MRNHSGANHVQIDINKTTLKVLINLDGPLIRCGLYRAADSLERLKHLRLAGKTSPAKVHGDSDSRCFGVVMVAIAIQVAAVPLSGIYGSSESAKPMLIQTIKR